MMPRQSCVIHVTLRGDALDKHVHVYCITAVDHNAIKAVAFVTS